MRLSRRSLISSLAAAPAATLLSRTVRAAGYPERPIHLIVPFAPGGNADIVGRIAGQLMGDGKAPSSSKTMMAPAAVSALLTSRTRRPTATRCWSARTGR